VSNEAERLITGTDVVTPRCAEAEQSDGVDVLGGGGLRDDVAVGTRPVQTTHAPLCRHVTPNVRNYYE